MDGNKISGLLKNTAKRSVKRRKSFRSLKNLWKKHTFSEDSRIQYLETGLITFFPKVLVESIGSAKDHNIKNNRHKYSLKEGQIGKLET